MTCAIIKSTTYIHLCWYQQWLEDEKWRLTLLKILTIQIPLLTDLSDTFFSDLVGTKPVKRNLYQNLEDDDKSNPPLNQDKDIQSGALIFYKTQTIQICPTW